MGIVEACGEGVEEGCAGELGEFTGCAVEGFVQGGVLCAPYVSLRCINLVWGLAISCSSGSGAGILSSMHSSIICVYPFDDPFFSGQSRIGSMYIRCSGSCIIYRCEYCRQ